MLQDTAEWAKHLRGENVASDFTEKTVTDFVLRHKWHIKTCLAVLDERGLRTSTIKEFAESLENAIKNALDATFPAQGWEFTSQISSANLDIKPSHPSAKYPAIFLTKRPAWERYGQGQNCWEKDRRRPGGTHRAARFFGR